jgi:hypothetical protein
MVEQVPSNDDGHGLGAARGGHPRDRSRSRHQPHRTLAGRKGAEYPEQGGAGGFGIGGTTATITLPPMRRQALSSSY